MLLLAVVLGLSWGCGPEPAPPAPTVTAGEVTAAVDATTPPHTEPGPTHPTNGGPAQPMNVGPSGRPSAPAAVRSVVLVTLDTTRADALGCYRDDDLGHTPRLDALAAESLVFERARTVAPLTLPAHASMMTGLWPPAHGVRDNGLRALPQAASTLAERASAAGLDTAAFVAAIVLDPMFGLDQGFDVYDAPDRAGEPAGVQTSGQILQRPAPAVVDAALEWLATHDPERRFFLWVHLFDPHLPYEAPAELNAVAGGDPYLAEVALADREVGRLVDGLVARGLLDETLLLVVGDHGEGHGDHQELTHSVFVYDSTLRVPFLVRYPDGYRAGERSDRAVSVADVQPTALAALGLEAGDVDGRSLFGAVVPEDRGVYFESYYGFLTYGWSPLAGWARRDAKYVHSTAPELFDLGADPTEARNLFGTGELEVEPFTRALEQVASRSPLDDGDAGGAVDEQMIAALEALGYVTGTEPPDGIPHPLAESDRASPAARRLELRRLQEATWFGDRGHTDEAIRRYQALYEDFPGNPAVLDGLAAYLIRARRHAEALPYLRAYLATGVERARVHNNLGSCLEATGDPEQALLHYRRALAIDPLAANALHNAARLCRELGLDEEAAEYEARLGSGSASESR